MQLHSVTIQRLTAVLLALVFAAAVSLAGGSRPAAGWQIETGEFHSDLSGKKLPLAVSIRAGLPFLSHFLKRGVLTNRRDRRPIPQRMA